MSDYEIFEIPQYSTLGGITLDVRIAFKTYGKLSSSADNVIVIPTFYGGCHSETEYMMADGRAIDADKYFVVIPNMLGNGYSTSPSNTPAPYGAGGFPLMTLYDNVVCQHQLLTEHLGVKHIRLVTGFSMGAQQTFQWGALYPDLVDAIAPICGAARVSDHNGVFLASTLSALTTDPAYDDGWYGAPPVKGLLAFGHVYAGWLFSQDFFRERLYEQIGLASPEDVVKFTQSYFLQNDANDLVAMARTWLNGDVSANPVFEGDFAKALGAISARAVVMPGDTDLYFRVADNVDEVALMPNAELRPIPSKWGHGAGFGIDPADNAFIDAALTELLG